MRKLIAFGIFLLAITWSCEDKFSSGNFNQYDLPAGDSVILPGDTFIGKKGIALAQRGIDWSSKVSSTKAFWHYSGANRRSIKEPGNVDFVPMISDTADLNDEDVTNALKKMNDNGQLRYLLGFKEPDNPQGANMTVAEALAAWPVLEQFNVPLGSPLCVEADGSWMDNFMAQAATAGLRIDYVTVQWEEEYDVDAFLGKMESIYNKYGKPIWIVRFTLANARLSQVMNFLQQVLPELESRDYIFRYAWEPGEVNTPTAFWDDAGELNNRGQYYANFQANKYISKGRDDWIDISLLKNVVVNGDFETGDLTGWSDISYGVNIESADVYNGSYSGKGDLSVSWGSAFVQVVPVESGGTYYISFAAKYLGEFVGVPNWFNGLVLSIKNPYADQTYASLGPIGTQVWSSLNKQVSIPDTVTSIKIVLWRHKSTPEVLVDNVFVAKIY